MEIKKYKKMSGGKYQVTIGNEELLLYDDIIIKHQLLLSKDIDDKKFKIIIKDNDIYTYYMLALNYIKKKLRSKKEVNAFLHNKDVNQQTTLQVIKMLEDNNCINDVSFAKAYIHDKLSFSNDGPYKIINSLKKLGIKDDIINQEITCFSNEIQLTKIDKYISKQIKTNHNKSSLVLKGNILNNLINQGYNKSLIDEQLSKYDMNDDDIYQKEYNKEYHKLKNKYANQELEYKLKQKMYQKGFRH